MCRPAGKALLALLLCCSAAESVDEVIRVRAMLVQAKAKQVQISSLQEQIALIEESDITLLMWNQLPDVQLLNSIQNQVITATGSYFSLIRSLSRGRHDSVQYVFYYRQSMFPGFSLHGHRNGKQMRAWLPFVVKFHLRQQGSQPLTLAALYVHFQFYQSEKAKQVLAEVVRKTSADGTPFALIGKFPPSVLNHSVYSSGRFYNTESGFYRRLIDVCPTFLTNGLETATLRNSPPIQPSGDFFPTRPLSIDIEVSQLLGKLHEQKQTGAEAVLHSLPPTPLDHMEFRHLPRNREHSIAITKNPTSSYADPLRVHHPSVSSTPAFGSSYRVQQSPNQAVRYYRVEQERSPHPSEVPDRNHPAVAVAEWGYQTPQHAFPRLHQLPDLSASTRHQDSLSRSTYGEGKNPHQEQPDGLKLLLDAIEYKERSDQSGSQAHQHTQLLHQSHPSASESRDASTRIHYTDPQTQEPTEYHSESVRGEHVQVYPQSYQFNVHHD